MDQAPKYQGSLEKQGRMKTWTWKKYWFVLKEGQLTYVKSQEKMSSQGHIDLAQAHSVRVITGNHGFPFEIVTRSRTHNLSALSGQSRDKWLKLIHDTMSWFSRNPSRKGSITSSRASCNSILDEDDDIEVRASLAFRSSSSPSASSGYSSTGSSRESGEAQGPTRDSGLEDTMYFNTNYSKVTGPSDTGLSNADVFARNSGKSIASARHPEASDGPQYEDVDMNLKAQHQELRRISQPKPQTGAGQLRVSLAARPESTMSDVSDIYAEVNDPMANIAISHIVEGYANIARNKGPQPQLEPSTDESEDLYDEVFDALNKPRQSTVVMRKSLQYQRDSELDDDYAEPFIPDTNTPASVPRQPPANKIQPSRGIKPPPPPKPVSVRKSMLPKDLEDYFQCPPIADLPHPRLELTYRSAFDDIRQFLANNRGPSEIYATVPKTSARADAILRLKSYLSVNEEVSA